MYHRADFYAIDDPFSAVDSHVAEHLFNEVVGPNGILNHSTRVVALNSTKFLPQFDWIVCLNSLFFTLPQCLAIKTCNV